MTAIETVSVYVTRQKEQFRFVGDNLLLYTRRLVATDMSENSLMCSVHGLEGHLANERRTTRHNTTDKITCETRKRCDASHFNEVSYGQWLKCNGTQGNAVPPPPIYGSKRSPPQTVIMLGKGTRPLSGAQT